MWRITDDDVLDDGARQCYPGRRLTLHVRPLDLRRLHHERIEAWILEQAGIVFDAKATPGALHMVMG